MRRLRWVIVLLVAATTQVAASTQVEAGVSKFDFTPREIRACIGGARRLCFSAYPSAVKLIACFRRNEKRLDRPCRTVFKRGLRRRGLT